LFKAHSSETSFGASTLWARVKGYGNEFSHQENRDRDVRRGLPLPKQSELRYENLKKELKLFIFLRSLLFL